MTYEEWKYARGDEPFFKAARNVNRNMDMHEEYSNLYKRHKEAFTQAVPENFTDFQELKYNNTGAWKQMVSDARKARNLAKKNTLNFVDNKEKSDIIKVGRDTMSNDDRNIVNRNMPNGLRNSPFHVLTEDEIKSIKEDILAIHADETVFHFNEGGKTGYDDDFDIINVAGDVLPDKNSDHPRDKMSSRAVIAHEYYGHRANRGTALPPGSWNDEFRASYMAAKNTPNLTDEDRYYLICDALFRASEAGVKIKNNNFIRRILYGY